MKRVVLIAVFATSTVALYGQHFYAGIQGGYAQGIQKNAIGTEIYGSHRMPAPENYNKVVLASFGQGPAMNMNFGYRPDSFSFFEAGIHGWSGPSVEWTRLVYQEEIGTKPYSHTRYTLRSNSACFSLSYGMDFRLYKRSTWHAKVGVLAGKSFIYGTETTTWYEPGLPKLDYAYTYDFGTAFSFGGLAALGVKYRVSNRIQLNGELFCRLMQTTIRSRTVTSYWLMGADKTHELLPEERHFDFYDGKPKNSATIDKIQSMHVSQNALGVNLGLLYTF